MNLKCYRFIAVSIVNIAVSYLVFLYARYFFPVGAFVQNCVSCVVGLIISYSFNALFVLEIIAVTF